MDRRTGPALFMKVMWHQHGRGYGKNILDHPWVTGTLPASPPPSRERFRTMGGKGGRDIYLLGGGYA